MTKLNNEEKNKLDNTCGNLRATKLGTHVKSLEDFVNEGVLSTRANDVTAAINELYGMIVNRDCADVQIPPPGFFTLFGDDETGTLKVYYNDEEHPPVFRHVETPGELEGTLYLYIADPEGENHYEMEIGHYIAVRHLDNYYTKAEIDAGYAIKNHAVNANTYGLGSTSKYGHVKTINGLTQASHSDGLALSAYQGKVLKTAVDEKVVTVEKQSSAESGYAATYVVKQNGSQVGVKINIPKDFLVRSAEVKTCTEVNVPEQGYNVGDRYIDFVVNAIDSSETAQHIYLNVKDLGIITHSHGCISNNGYISDPLLGNDYKNAVLITDNDGKITVTSYGSNQIMQMDGTASKGSTGVAHTDHVHPIDTSREAVANKVTSLSSSSNNTQYPSAKCVYDLTRPGTFTELLAEIYPLGTYPTYIFLDKDYVNTDNIEGMILEGSKRIYGNGHVIDFNNVQNCNFRIEDIGNSITFVDCVFINCNATSLIVGGNTRVFFENCVFKYNSVTSSLFKLTDRDGSLLHLLDCTFMHNNANAGELIEITAGDAYTGIIKNCKFFNNNVDREHYLILAGASSYCKVEDCYDYGLTDNLEVSWRRLHYTVSGVTPTYTIDEYEEKENKITSISNSSTNVQYPSAKAVYDKIHSLTPEIGSFDELYDLLYDFYNNGVDDTTFSLTKDYVHNSGDSNNIIVFGGHTLTIQGNYHTIQRRDNVESQIIFSGETESHQLKPIKVYNLIFLNGYSREIPFTAKNTEFYNCIFINFEADQTDNHIESIEAHNSKFINCTFISCNKGVSLDANSIMINCVFNGNTDAVYGVNGSKVIDCSFITANDTVNGSEVVNSNGYTKNEVDALIGDINDYITG